MNWYYLYYNYLYYTPCEFFGWWFSTASQHMSLEFFSVIWPILTMLYFGYFRLVLRFSTLLVPLQNLWRPFQVRQLQLVSPSPLYFIAFRVLWQISSTGLSFSFLRFSHCSSLGRRNPLDGKVCFYFLAITTKCSLLARIRWSVGISKS